MAAIDVTDKVMPNDVDPYTGYSVTLLGKLHLNYGYRIKGDCI